ncbi:C40 family peptidase [Nonlabens ulvanivorans]|uniref:C40 family peptidase n=1 Tax=Nonlabens ulvanivorans TaxID=906888 RepID=UPI0029433B61|nr:C40 family peptidase [Nonlabens ulvanivorans]WOI22781.1 C40 family peptidase [Nonlabens ulvanivorans]
MMMLFSLSRKRIYKVNLTKIFVVSLTSMMLLGTSSCKSSKPRIVTTKKEAAKRYPDRVYTSSREVKAESVEKPVSSTAPSRVDDKNTAPILKDAIETALSYKGTKYKYGGSSRSGMDCSGLIHVSFKEAGKSVPRTSASLYNAASTIDFKQVEKGDLLFFATGKNKTRVNHVGLVVKTTPAEISFVHSTTSRGVIVSTMNEGYWLNAYLSAGRLE